MSRVGSGSTSKQHGVVPAPLAGPLDRAVRGLFGVSWGRARTWIEAGKVRVGDAVVTEATARVVAGDAVVVDERAARPVGGGGGGAGADGRASAGRPSHGRGSIGELADADVVHVDAQVVVVAKPSGISTVPFEGDAALAGRGARGDGTGEVDTLDARVRRWLERRARGSRGGRPNLGVVHRLDKETSGLVVFTRTWLAKQSLASQFRRHTVHRLYLALAHGDVRSRTVRSFLLEDRGDGLRGSARGTPGARGREAITHVERVESIVGAGDARRTVATVVTCRLETGRTHQIRIHLSEAGHPLVGERVYVRRFPGPMIEAPRLMLHAAELGFVHPSSEHEVRWALPMPDDMRAVVERLRATRPA